MNKLYIDDNGIGNVVIKLNNQDITSGIQCYKIDRSADDDGYVMLTLTMRAIPEYINIKSKKNSKSSNN